MNANKELFSQAACLQQSPCMTYGGRVRCRTDLPRHSHDKLTMMAEVEASVDPYALLRDRHVVLGINRPLSSLRKLFIESICHGRLVLTDSLETSSEEQIQEFSEVKVKQ